MSVDYKKITEFMLMSGKRLAIRAGNIADIGITKTEVTEEDLIIERGFKDIISTFGGDHLLYAEEENNVFQNSDNVWVADPISSTFSFIQGLPHYSIVISHLVNHKVVFGAVYEPSVNELYTAYVGKGAFLNEQPIKVSNGTSKVIVRPSTAWKQPDIIKKVTETLKDYTIENNRYSIALNYCAVASGKADGIAAFTKDSFPEFAGSLIIQEAGGKFTNIQGESNIKPTDRIFVGGNEKFYNELFLLVKEVVF